MKKSFFYSIFIIFVSVFSVQADPPFSDDRLNTVYEESIQWLKNQIVPNETVDSPAPDRRKMILSYKISEGNPDYKYLAKRTFTYDNAVAAVAFTMAGKYREAESILNTLSRLVREDGSLWFSYNTHNSWPDEGDHEGAIIRSGALAWAGYSLSHYVSVRNQDDREFYKNDVIGRRFTEASEKIAGYLLSMQVREKSDPRYGLVTGGKGTYKTEYSEDKKSIEEVYNYDPVGWVSVEHNIDTYFLLKSIYLVTGEKYFFNKAELLKKSILKAFWDRKAGQFIRGIKADGTRDTALPLDGASWGALFLKSTGAEGRTKTVLNTMDRNFITADNRYSGYAPYYNEKVYEDISLNSHMFEGRGETEWKDLNVVWSEGSLGAASAWIRGGDSEKGLEIIRNMAEMSVGGGLIYSSVNLPRLFSDYPSVAGTGWFIIASELYRDPEKLFWSE